MRIELNAQFGLEPIEDVFFVAKIIQSLIGNICLYQIKEVYQPCISKLAGAFGNNTSMQPVEKVLLIVNGAVCVDVNVIWTVVADQCKPVVNGLSPKNRPFAIDFNNILGIDIRAILMVVLQKKQHDCENVKAAALTVPVVEVDDLLFAAVPS